ncbi:MAG TPA: TRAP transporter large permease subunit, partial [Stellaceae bacterium]|nr:TRAP transporter large permease subunit [Stellaceae bacterium]
TGVPTKLGALLVDAAGISLPVMVLMGFVFGVILGCGLPPAPVYILVAVVIAPPFIRVGVNPWVVHFFAFFLGVFGELTPPTSITAAITSKIANASFYVTLLRSVKICVSLFAMMAAIFVHPELVVQPGWDQIGAALLVGTAALGITFSLQATFTEVRATDWAVRIVLAAVALAVLLTPNYPIATALAVPVVGAIGYWLLVRRHKLDTDILTVTEIDSARLAASAASEFGKIG